MSASAVLATLKNRARSSMDQQLRRLFPPNGLIEMADSDSTTIRRRVLDAATRSTRKRKRFLELAGLRCPTILCEFLIIFEDFYFFRRIERHSLVGLDNGAMLLLGGYDWGSGGASQTGIWELKDDQWSRIGEISKVWNKIKKKSNSCISAGTFWICYLRQQIRLLLRKVLFGDSSSRPGRKRRIRSCPKNWKPTRKILLSRPLPSRQWLLYLNVIFFSFRFSLFLSFSNKIFL